VSATFFIFLGDLIERTVVSCDAQILGGELHLRIQQWLLFTRSDVD
jgi:hypothetical protein